MGRRVICPPSVAIYDGRFYLFTVTQFWDANHPESKMAASQAPHLYALIVEGCIDTGDGVPHDPPCAESSDDSDVETLDGLDEETLDGLDEETLEAPGAESSDESDAETLDGSDLELSLDLEAPGAESDDDFLHLGDDVSCIDTDRNCRNPPGVPMEEFFVIGDDESDIDTDPNCRNPPGVPMEDFFVIGDDESLGESDTGSYTDSDTDSIDVFEPVAFGLPPALEDQTLRVSELFKKTLRLSETVSRPFRDMFSGILETDEELLEEITEL